MEITWSNLETLRSGVIATIYDKGDCRVNVIKVERHLCAVQELPWNRGHTSRKCCPRQLTIVRCKVGDRGVMSLVYACLYNLLGKRIGADSRLEPPKEFGQECTRIPYPIHVRESDLSTSKKLMKE